MTDRRDLKRRIRDRMAKTGESYTTARMHVLADRGEAPVAAPAAPAPIPAPAAAAPQAGIPVVEMVDVTELAVRVGLRCGVAVSSSVPAHIDRERVLTRIRDALVGTEVDPQTEVLRAGVLRGELSRRLRAPGSHPILDLYRGTRPFLARAAAGIGGVSDSGKLLALVIDEQPIVCVLSIRRRSGETRGKPWLIVTTLDGVRISPGMRARSP